MNEGRRIRASCVRDALTISAANREGPWDGRSWAAAFTGLQEALGLAYRGAEEVWVAAGTYRTAADGDRRRSLRLLGGLALYGGFAGAEERREQRDWTSNETTLSGDLGSPLGEAGIALHVVIGADGAVLGGFTVADGAGIDGHGAGLLCYNAVSPAVRNCRFVRLRAHDGGAVYACSLSSLPAFRGVHRWIGGKGQSGSPRRRGQGHSMKACRREHTGHDGHGA